jgi:CheY-like chemotaxis protein
LSPNEKQIRTLVVEDNALLLRMYANLLRSMRMFDIVATLERGEKVLDYLFYGEIDFVVLDLLLPGVKGLDVLRLARSWGAPVDVIASRRMTRPEPSPRLPASVRSITFSSLLPSNIFRIR